MFTTMASGNDFLSSLVLTDKGKVWTSTLSYKMCPRKQTTEPKLLILVSVFSGEDTSSTDTSYCIPILWEVIAVPFLLGHPVNISTSFSFIRRPWFHRVIVNPDKTTISTAYMDAAGVGKIISLSQAIFEGMENKTKEICELETGKLPGGCECQSNEDCISGIWNDCLLNTLRNQSVNQFQFYCPLENYFAHIYIDHDNNHIIHYDVMKHYIYKHNASLKMHVI